MIRFLSTSSSSPHHSSFLSGTAMLGFFPFFKMFHAVSHLELSPTSSIHPFTQPTFKPQLTVLSIVPGLQGQKCKLDTFPCFLELTFLEAIWKQAIQVINATIRNRYLWHDGNKSKAKTWNNLRPGSGKTLAIEGGGGMGLEHNVPIGQLEEVREDRRLVNGDQKQKWLMLRLEIRGRADCGGPGRQLLCTWLTVLHSSGVRLNVTSTEQLSVIFRVYLVYLLSVPFVLWTSISLSFQLHNICLSWDNWNIHKVSDHIYFFPSINPTA